MSDIDDYDHTQDVIVVDNGEDDTILEERIQEQLNSFDLHHARASTVADKASRLGTRIEEIDTKLVGLQALKSRNDARLSRTAKEQDVVAGIKKKIRQIESMMYENRSEPIWMNEGRIEMPDKLLEDFLGAVEVGYGTLESVRRISPSIRDSLLSHELAKELKRNSKIRDVTETTNTSRIEDIAYWRQQAAHWKTMCVQKETACDRAWEQLGKARKDKVTEANKVSGLEDTVEEQETVIQKLQQKITTLARENQRVKTKNKEMSDSLVARLERINDLESSDDQHTQKAVDDKIQLERQAVKIKALETKLRVSESRATALKYVASLQKTSMAEFGTQLDLGQLEYQSLYDEFESKKATHSIIIGDFKRGVIEMEEYGAWQRRTYVEWRQEDLNDAYQLAKDTTMRFYREDHEAEINKLREDHQTEISKMAESNKKTKERAKTALDRIAVHGRQIITKHEGIVQGLRDEIGQLNSDLIKFDDIVEERDKTIADASDHLLEVIISYDAALDTVTDNTTRMLDDEKVLREGAVSAAKNAMQFLVLGSGRGLGRLSTRK